MKMQNVIVSLLLVATFTFAVEETKSESKRVSLEDAKKFAIDHNYEVQGLRRAVEEAHARKGQARSHFFPKLSVLGGADTTMVPAGNLNGAIAYGSASYNLFNGFEDSHKTSIADLELDKAEVKLRLGEFRVGLDVERAFHNTIFKTSVIALKEQAIKANDSHRSMAAVKRRSGLASDADMMEFDLKDATLRSDQILLEQELEESRAQLKKLFGDEVGSKIEPVGRLQHEHLKGNLMTLINKIKDQNEAVLIGSRDLSISEYEKKVVNGKWLPKIDVEVDAGYLPWDLRQVPAGTAMLGGKIVARLDVFSGFEQMYQRREAAAKQLRLEAELKQSILSTITDTENTFRRISTIQARVDLEEENESRARRYYDSVLSEYRRGIKNSADLRNAADGLYETRVRRETYKFEFLNQRLELERALGTKLETEVISEKKS